MFSGTFTKGGIHPRGRKELAYASPIELVKPPDKAYIPLAQHIGAPCKAVVEVGQYVTIGEPVGTPEGFVSAPVHATVSGKVSAITVMPTPLGRSVSTIVIDNDGKEQWFQLNDDPGYYSQANDVLMARIKSAGIVGMGGATFPTHVKLSPPKEKTIDAVLINGAECEPYLTADHRVMVESPTEVIEGLRILMKILNVKRGYIGIEDNKRDAIKKLQEASSQYSDIEIWTLKTKYPQGAEKMLIKSIIGREVPSCGLPMDVGVVVQNVGTAFAVYEACRYGKPLIERVVCVTGNGVNAPKNLRARIGTTFAKMIESCGGLKPGAAKIISGGPMMGFAVYTLDLPVIKGTSGIVVMLENETAHADKYENCIRCGRCVEACPMGLMPLNLSVLAEKGFYEETREYNITDCFECGCCTYVCPAKRPIVQQIRLAKSMLKR